MDISRYFKSVLEEDECAIVICNVEHKIIYMNPAACERYKKHGGERLIGSNLLDCHNTASNELIIKTVEWFKADASNNRVHTYYNEKESKDVYMVALRDDNGDLIGYYEKHEYRLRDNTPFYGF